MRSAFSSRAFSGVLLTGLAAGPWAAAQAPSFEAVKKAHAAEVARTVQPLREGYCRALRTLEQTLASKGDYDGARVVRKERLGIEALLRPDGAAGKNPPLPAAGPDGSVRLDAEAAGTSGGAKLDESGSRLTGWDTAGAAARWPLPPGLNAGGYEIEVSLLLSPAAGKGAGLFQIKENFHTLSRSLNPAAGTGAGNARGGVSSAGASSPGAVSGPGAPAAPANENVTLTLGTLRLSPNASVLEIKTVTPEPGASLLLRSLRLIPVTASAS